MSSIWKSGQSAKPTYCHQCILAIYSWRLVLVGIFSFMAVVSCFYLYLDMKYILDGPYDISGPKELYEKDKVTVRVVAPDRIQDLAKFVTHYSICPVVDRIIISWHHSGDFPREDTFQYTTTHSKVFFERVQREKFWDDLFNVKNVNTPGVFMVDAMTKISCEHLSFANNVWQTSTDGIVGITPNLMQFDLAQKQMVVKPSSSVVWENKYNTLFWDGLIFKKEYLQSLADAKDILASISTHQLCADLLVPFFMLKASKASPIWVDVDIETAPLVSQLLPLSALMKKVHSEEKGSSDNTNCPTFMMELLKINELPNSYGKTSMAKDFLTW